MANLTLTSVIDTVLSSATLSDARTNLGVEIGADVQAYDPQLAAIAGLATTDGGFIVGNGTTFVLETAVTARASLGLATVAATGAYADISGTPTLATVATSGLYSDLSGTPSLATVATSGAYSDLTGTPTIPSQLADLSDVDSTVGTPSDGDILVFRSAGNDFVLESKPAGGSNPALNDVTDVTITSVANNELLAYDTTSGEWINQTPTEAGFATVATSGAYGDLSGTPGLATVATSGAYADLSGTPSLATVATSGAYSDLSGTPTLPSGAIVGTTDTQTVTNKTIDGDSNTLSNLDIGNEVDWASATDVADRSATPASGDKLLMFEAGVGLRKIDWDDLPSGGGSSTLDGLTDVTITSVAGNESLVYDSVSGDWVNLDLLSEDDIFNKSASATDSVTIGNQSGRSMTGTRNVAVGNESLRTMTSGFDNVAVGHEALELATSNAHTNVAVGRGAGKSITGGSGFVGIGANAGNTYANMTDCIIIGSGADTSASGETGSIAIGKSVISSGTDGLNLGNVIHGTMTSSSEVIKFRGSSSSTADPSTTELPTSREWGIHKNTTSGNVFLAYNDGGSIVKVQLT